MRRRPCWASEGERECSAAELPGVSLRPDNDLPAEIRRDGRPIDHTDCATANHQRAAVRQPFRPSVASADVEIVPVERNPALAVTPHVTGYGREVIPLPHDSNGENA